MDFATTVVGNPNSITINDSTHGNGGTSTNGMGGAGGAVTNVNIVDVFTDTTGNPVLAGALALRSGMGGDGSSGGGVGGNISGFLFTAGTATTGGNLGISALAGKGGNATGAGNGGKGEALWPLTSSPPARWEISP